MRNAILKLMAVAAFIIISSIGAYAIGIGGYGMFGYGETMYSNPVIPFTNYDMHGSYIAGGGLVIDANCSGTKLFNYRIAIGAAQTFSAKKNHWVEPGKTTRVQMMNTFGLGIVRRERFRLWIGPQVGITTLYGSYRCDKNRKFTTTNSKGITSFWPMYIEKLQYSMMGGSFGLALGMNFNFKKNVTLFIEGSWRYDVYYGMKRQEYYIPNPYSSGYLNLSKGSWVKAYTDGLNLSLGIMYRFGESAGENSETGTGGLK